MEFSNWAYLMDQKEVHSKMNNTGKGGCSLEAQISSARPRSLEMLHRRTKSSLICLSTVLDDIIDSTWEDGVSLLSVSRFVAGLSLGRNNSHSAPWFRPRSLQYGATHAPLCSAFPKRLCISLFSEPCQPLAENGGAQNTIHVPRGWARARKTA